MNISLFDANEILNRALDGAKVFPDEAIHLCEHGDLLSLGMVAAEIARRHNPTGLVTYMVDKTVAYSNVCQPNCPFCTGTVTREHPHAFTKSAEEVAEVVAAAAAAGATQVTLQGGHRIDLPWEYYTGLLRAIRERTPHVAIQAFSPTEIMLWNALFHKSSGTIIAELREAGMDLLFAGGVETMTTRVKEHQALLRGPWNEWFDIVHRCVDNGVDVVVPFAFGFGESARERVGHLLRTRAVQTRTAAAGRAAFRAIVPFTVNRGGLDPMGLSSGPQQPVYVEGTPVEASNAHEEHPATGHEYLRMVALARILCDNIPVVQASPVTQGLKIGQIALQTGATDFGGTHMEFDRAELAAGRVGPITAEEFVRLARDAGRAPARRDARYEVVEAHSLS